VWWLAARPRTLTVAAAPVIVGTAAALADGRARPLPAAAALLAALLIQVGTNFANDLFDCEKGADAPDRIGPQRAVQTGLVSAAGMRAGMLAAFAAAALVGLYLVAVGGWPIAAIGALSIAAGIAYTGGPFPLGYRGLGDVTVFVFFGVVAVCGTYYVQALALPPVVVAASFPVGALATGVLVVNNVRDLETDRRAGKRTLAVRLGRRAGRIEYAALLLSAYALLPALWIWGGTSAGVLLALLTLPWALSLIRTVATRTDGPGLNTALAGTAQLGLFFAVLLGAGWLA
jgi:1,4-dihydroxy-2-naphthoate octaprenyltransferase